MKYESKRSVSQSYLRMRLSMLPMKDFGRAAVSAAQSSGKRDGRNSPKPAEPLAAAEQGMR